MPSRSSERAVLHLSRDQIWAIYDLTVAKAEALESAEALAQTNLGSDRYRQSADGLKQVLDGPSVDPFNEYGIDRAAASLFGELANGALKQANESGSWAKDDLRSAARRVVAASLDPRWGDR